MILLKQIKLHNFISHEDTTVDFQENEKVLIDGASGAGKSSIFEAIIWALYGQGRADNRALVRKGAKNAEVTLSLSREDETVVITRRITSGGAGKHTLEVSIQQADGTRTALPLSGVRETQGWIDRELIGASYLLFVNSVAYVQGNTESFVAQTAPKRKELLLEIVKAEDYSKLYEKARQELSRLSNEESHILGQISELEASLEAMRGRIGLKDQCIKDIADASKKGEFLAVKREDLQEIARKLMTKKITLDLLSERLAAARSNEQSLLTELTNKKKRVEGIHGNYEELVTRRREEVASLTKELENASAHNAAVMEKMSQKPIVHDRNPEIERIRKQIDDIASKPVCPSGEKCPYSGGHAKHVQELEDQAENMDKLMVVEAIKLAEWTVEMDALPKQIDVRKSQEDFRKLVQELNNLESVGPVFAEIPVLEKKYAEAVATTTEAQKKFDDASILINDGTLERTERELQILNEQEKEVSNTLTRATILLEMIEKEEKEYALCSERVDTLGKTTLKEIKERARKIGMVKDAFGSKGVETIVIDYLLPKLEDKINEVLSKLSDFRVRLDTQRKSSDGESVIEGLFITILNELNEEMPFESYSGGEKLKISVAISEALATLQKVGFRMLDETFIGLDENSTESFAEVLDSLQSSFSQVLCISHLIQIKELLDKRIEIIKTNNVSYVK